MSISFTLFAPPRARHYCGNRILFGLLVSKQLIVYQQLKSEIISVVHSTFRLYNFPLMPIPGSLNTLGSYRCVCRDGYRMTDGVDCVDHDECFDGAHTCSHVCYNSPGSYSCKCPNGYKMDRDDRTCIDIDECTTNIHNCPHQSHCHNTLGTFRCHCLPGYQMKNGYCADIDECVNKIHDCSHEAKE